MKQLWAPWRLDYITGAKMKNCFLCNGFKEDADRDNLILKRSEECAIIINKYPYNNGHLTVAPYRHIDRLESLTENEASAMMRLTQEAIRALNRFMHPDGYNVGLNLGAGAGAGLKEHIHTHIVPRWKGDTNFMPVIGETKVIPQTLLDLWDRLYPILNPAKAAL